MNYVLVINDQAEMPIIVLRLLAAFRYRDELIAKVYESHRGVFAPKGEFQKGTIELQRTSISPTSSAM